MAASTHLIARLTTALCGAGREAEMVTILNAATHAAISKDLANLIRSVWGESAGEEVISALTAGSVTPSKECELKSSSALGRSHAEFLTLLAAVS